MIAIWSQIQCVNSSPPSAAYMLQWIRSALVPIMAVAYSAPSHYLNQSWVIVSWTLGTNFNEILIKIQNFSFTKMHLKISSAKRWPLCPGGGGGGFVKAHHDDNAYWSLTWPLLPGLAYSIILFCHICERHFCCYNISIDWFWNIFKGP